MQSIDSGAVSADVDDIEFPFDSPSNSELENRIVSPCGRFESFDYKGSHFEVDWDEILGDDDEEEIPHEQVMAELDQYIQDLRAHRGAGR